MLFHRIHKLTCLLGACLCLLINEAQSVQQGDKKEIEQKVKKRDRQRPPWGKKWFKKKIETKKSEPEKIEYPPQPLEAQKKKVLS